MRPNNEYVHGVGIGLIGAGISSIIIPNAEYFVVVIGACFCIFAYILWYHEVVHRGLSTTTG